MTVAEAVTDRKLMTAEELMLLPDDDVRRELVRGEVVDKMPSGGKHARVALRIARRLDEYAERIGSGFCTSADGGFVLSRAPDTVGAPDCAFVSSGRAGGEQWTDSFYQFAPDLAVEIVSPGDRPGETEDKVRDYLSAGTKLVWVVYPDRRMAIVWRGNGTVSFISESGMLSGEDVLPGFELPLSDVLPPVDLTSAHEGAGT